MKTNVYEIVRKNILERLEEAINNNIEFQWVKPWKGNGIPRNFKTKKPYSGINLLILPKGGYYLTMKQVNEMKGHVKKGGKSYPICFWTYVEKKDTEDENKNEIEGKDGKKYYPIFKYYRVFHQSDIEGINFPEITNENHTLDTSCEELIDKYSEEVKINVVKGSENAFYSPKLDSITVPDNSQFKDVNEYYSTVFHEMVHSTGHKTRLDRFTPDTSFGDTSYSKEELVAEIGSSILRAYFNIKSVACDTNSIAYLKGWYDQIKNGKVTEITSAAQQAQKAVNFIVNKVEEKTNSNCA